MSVAKDLGALSREILLTAAELTGSMESGALAELLYLANAAPLTPGWLRGLPDARAVEALLLRNRSASACLAEHWTFRHDEHWLQWRPRAGDQGAPTRFKLYISSTPEHAGPALWASLGVMAERGAPPFKIAREPRRMLRPDRMVVYLRSEAELRRLAGDLAARLSGLEAQGVPFSGALDGTGVLSWGYDPPPPVRPYGASWRVWVTRKLSAYLHASDAPSATGRVEFALERMHEDGVDAAAWEPLPDLWA